MQSQLDLLPIFIKWYYHGIARTWLPWSLNMKMQKMCKVFISKSSYKGVHVTRLPDQTEKPPQTDLLATRSDDSGGWWRVPTLPTQFRWVELRVFSSKIAAAQAAWPPL